MTSFDVDTIAPPSGGNAWKPQIGDLVKGVIVYAGLMPPRDSFDGKKKEQSLRIDLDVTGGTGTADPVSVYVVVNADVEGDGYAKRDAQAVAAAVRAAGEKRLTVGGTLAIKRIEDAETKMGKARNYVAEYQPPTTTPEPAADAAGGAVTGLI